MPGAKKNAERGAELISVEATVLPHQRAEFGGRQYRRAVDQDEVQPDAQPRQTARPDHGVGGCRGGDHQARAGQDSVAVRLSRPPR